MSSLTPNLLKTWEDIRNNPEHWNQKFSLVEFHDPQGKPWWTKDYNFIPHWKRFKAAQDWIKHFSFPEYNCKIGWNANNEILLVSQNYFGEQRLKKERKEKLLNEIRKKIHKEIDSTNDKSYQEELKRMLKVSTFKDYEELNNFDFLYEEELKELETMEKHWDNWIKENYKGKIGDSIDLLKNKSYDLSRNDLALFWKKQLYFITSFTYTNNYKLTVEIRARRCQLLLTYYNWTSSKGVGVINQAPKLIKDWTDKPKKDKNGRNYLDEQYRLHYDFCGDLGIKKIEQQAFTSFQPSFQLFRAKVPQGSDRVITWSDQSTQSPEKRGQLAIPTDIKLSRFGKKEAADLRGSWWKDFKKSALAKLLSLRNLGGLNPIMYRELAEELLNAKAVLVIGPNEMDPSKGAYFSKMENKEEVLFPKNPTFTKWLKEQPHLWDHTTFQFYLFNKITMTANGRYLGIVEKDGKFILPYKLFINYSPGNLYYRWEFAFITVKCELSHQGTFEDWTNPNRIMQGINFKLGGKVLATGGGFGFGTNWKDVGEDAGKIKDGDDPAAEQEAQTERMFKNTFRSFGDKSIEPSQFNSNTIDFHYSLGEFFNRLTDPIFFYRVEISELLYNRLGWTNNKSHALNLPLSWKELGTWTQKEGQWKWSNVILQKDKDNFWTNIMTRGYYLDNGTELTNPKLAFAHASNHIAIGGNAWNISQAEEEIIEKKEIIEEDIKVASGNVNDKEWGHGTYIAVSDEAAEPALRQLSFNHWNEYGKGWCWGCSGYVGNKGIFNSPVSCDVVFILEKGNKGNSQIATCEAGVDYHVRVERSGDELQVFFKRREEKITYETKLKDPVKTVEQEIDETELENEVEDEVEEEIEGENEEEMEKGIGQEKEQEAEVEDEPEQEQEKEQEEEKEQETEKEKEDETEKEQEKEQEQEKESEKEEESEEEREEEEETEY